jgi:hypothetical protein
MFSPNPDRCSLDGAATQINTFSMSNWKKVFTMVAQHPIQIAHAQIV